MDVVYSEVGREREGPNAGKGYVVMEACTNPTTNMNVDLLNMRLRMTFRLLSIS